MGNVLNKKNTLKNLKKKGFVPYEGKSDDHIWLEFWKDGKMSNQRTKISHGSDKDLEDFHIGVMAKQTEMSEQFFMEFAKCNKSQDDYIAHLEEKGIILQ
jgi:hypothetical protein